MESSSRCYSKMHEFYKAGIGLHPNDLVLSKVCSPAQLSLALKALIMIPGVEKTATGAFCSPADWGSAVDMEMALLSGLSEAPELCPPERLRVICLPMQTVCLWHSWMALFDQVGQNSPARTHRVLP